MVTTALVATRNTCFAIISAIETDLRETVQLLAEMHGITDLLPTDVREIALRRWASDHSSGPGLSPENDFDLLPYSDFADLSKIIASQFSNSPLIAAHVLSVLAAVIDMLNPIRHRVCHSRPLEPDDLPLSLDGASRLLALPELHFATLKATVARLSEDMPFVLNLVIPAFWAADDDRVYNNLPLPEFDETGFLGRNDDRRQVTRLLLSHYPVVSIVGEGGVGKTALAQRCLYDLLDMSEAPYDAIVWTSLKASTLTPSGVQEVTEQVRTTLGLLAQLASALGTPDSASQTVEALVEELHEYMRAFRVLLVIDNLETLSSHGLRPLLAGLPAGSKILITSRVGLGEFEARYALSGLDKPTATALLRSYGRVVGVDLLAKAADALLQSYAKKLFLNPLLIKWFVAGIARGSSPDALLSRSEGPFAEALAFCFANLFDRLSIHERDILHVLASARRPLSLAELHYLLSDRSPRDVDWALNTLYNSSMLQQSASTNDPVRYRLSDSGSEFIARQRPPGKALFDQVQLRIRELRNIAELENVRQNRYTYDVFAVRARNSDERIVAVYLRRALDAARRKQWDATHVAIEEAKRLVPQSSEVWRVSGLVLGQEGDHFRALQDLENAVALDGQSTIARYTLALFLLRETGDAEGALVHLEAAVRQEPDDLTLQSAKAQALVRLGNYAAAEELYLRVIDDKRFSELGWRHRVAIFDQACECYRRWSEKDATDRDDGQFREHIDRALGIVERAAELKLFDEQTRERLSRVLNEALWHALHRKDSGYAERVLERAAAVVAQMPARPLALHSRGIFEQAFAGSVAVLRLLATLSAEDSGGGAISLRPAGESDPVPSGYGTGVIHTLVAGGSYGFIEDSSGSRLFFHRSHVVSGTRWESLRMGAMVRFRVGQNHQGKCAVDVSLSE
ncbi:MAG TPA: tetratricopeptide repeat protein [Candidatus Udaeobacter sp.]|jgi:LuxR family glucitol operon transcriptional activator|nr:tetratricopeptide repeat protein [Candidatus Udaeobacter sp.]